MSGPIIDKNKNHHRFSSEEEKLRVIGEQRQSLPQGSLLIEHAEYNLQDNEYESGPNMASQISYSQTDLIGNGAKSNTEQRYSSAGGTTKYVFDRNTNQRYAIGSMAITAFNEDTRKMSVDDDPYAETEQVIVNSDSQVITSSLNASGKFAQNSSTIQTDKSPGDYVN